MKVFEIFLDLELKRKNNAFALKCIKESVDDNILPLISEAKTTKEALNTLERSFVVRWSIEVVEEAREEHIDAHEPHCAQPQVDENLVIPTTKLADDNMMIPATKLADENLVILAIELVDENLMNPTTKLTDESLVNRATELVDDSEAAIEAINAMVNTTINIVDVKFDEECLANDEWLQVMQKKHHIDMMLFSEKIPLESVEDNLFVAT